MVHYVGLSGFRGQVPSYSEAHGAFETAVACLAERYKLEIAQLEKLSIDGHIGLDIEHHEDEYLEVLECNCDRVNRHILPR